MDSKELSAAHIYCGKCVATMYECTDIIPPLVVVQGLSQLLDNSFQDKSISVDVESFKIYCNGMIYIQPDINVHPGEVSSDLQVMNISGYIVDKMVKIKGENNLGKNYRNKVFSLCEIMEFESCDTKTFNCKIKEVVKFLQELEKDI